MEVEIEVAYWTPLKRYYGHIVVDGRQIAEAWGNTEAAALDAIRRKARELRDALDAALADTTPAAASSAGTTPLGPANAGR